MKRIVDQVNNMTGSDAEAVKNICTEIGSDCVIQFGKHTSENQLYKLLTGPAALTVWEALKKAPHKVLEFDIKYEGDKVSEPSYATQVWEMLSRGQLDYQEKAGYIVATYNDSVYAYTK